MAECPTTYSGQRVDELLRCPICLDRYNQPRILPCQHTFCHSPCLQGLIDFRSRIVRCPECRAEHLIPREGANGFPNNLIISNFLDLQPQSIQAGEAESRNPERDSRGGAYKCGICEKDGETLKCAHCDKLLCASCRKSHVTQLKFDIGRTVNQIRRGLPKLSESIATSEQKGEVVKQHVESVKAEVRDVIARYIKQLKDREKLLNSELDTFLQGETRNLRLKQENVEVELASVSSYCDSTEGLLNRSTDDIPDSELVALKQQCSEYMEQIRSVDTGSDPDIKLVKLEIEGQQLNSGIMNFGSIVVTTPGTLGGNGTPRSSNRITGNPQRARPRWSSPQPLHELYTRDANTPPPASPSPTIRNPVITPSPVTGPTQRVLVPSIGIGPHNEHLIPSYLRSTYNNRPSPMLSARTSSLNPPQHMYRLATSPDNSLQTLEQVRRIDEMIGNNPQVARLSSIFSRYVPDPEPEDRPQFGQEDRSPALINGRHRHERHTMRGMNRRREPIIIAPINTDQDRSAFPGRSTYPDIDSMGTSSGPNPMPSDVALAQDIAQDILHNRQSVAFSVDFGDGPNSGESSVRRGRRMRQLQRNRGRSRRGNENAGNRERSRNREEPQPRTSPNEPTSEEGPRPFPLSRTRTFTMDETEGGNSNNNNNADTEISRPNIDPANIEDELDNVDLEMFIDDTSAAESLTVSRSKNNYKRKSQAKKVIGGSRSSDPGGFTWPRGVAVCQRNDSIVVADSSNHRVQIFDCNGQFVNEFGKFGTAAGEFDCLAGVVCNYKGEVIVSDRYNHRIQVFDRYGDLKNTCGREGISNGQLSYPWGVTCDLNNNIYVVDKENHRIQVFSSQGEFVRVFGSFGEEPGHFNHPSYITVTPDNKIVISDTDNHRVQIFSLEGQYLSTFGCAGSEIGQMQSPKGVAVDRQGFIIVADSGNSRIQVFRGNGRAFTSFGSHGSDGNQFKAIEGVCIMSDGRVVVCDKENHRIQIF